MARLTLDHSTLSASAVALMVGAVRLHTGIAFRRRDDSIEILHLASHCKVRAAPTAGWSYAVPVLDVIDLVLLAAYCVMLDRERPLIPYGLKFEESSLDDDGRFTPGPNESGMTCSTFVLAIFEWATIPLLSRESWPSRPDDTEAQLKLVAYLRTTDATKEHIEAVEREVGCMRIRPEEVAAATTTEPRPIGFVDAEVIGLEVLAEFDALRI